MSQLLARFRSSLSDAWRGDGRAYILLTFAFVCMALNVIVGRAAHADVPPLGLSFWRWSIAVLLFTPFAIASVREQWDLIRANWRLLALISLVMIPLGNTLVYVGLQSTSALNGGLIPVARPAIILVFAWLLFRGTVTRYQWLGIFIAMTGVVTVLLRGDFAVLADLDLNRGDLWLVASTFGIASYQTLIGRAPPELNPRALLLTTMALGIPMLLPFYVWESVAGRPVELNWTTAGAVAYVAVFPSIIAVYFINAGIAQVGPARAGIFNYLQPLFVAGIAIPILGESMRWYHPVALVLVAGGIVVASRRRNGGHSP